MVGSFKAEFLLDLVDVEHKLLLLLVESIDSLPGVLEAFLESGQGALEGCLVSKSLVLSVGVGFLEFFD